MIVGGGREQWVVTRRRHASDCEPAALDRALLDGPSASLTEEHQESPLAISALVFKACAVLGVLSWCVAALLFVRARGDYRGPSGPASWLSPFAMWESANYKGAAAVRIRRSLIVALTPALRPCYCFE